MCFYYIFLYWNLFLVQFSICSIGILFENWKIQYFCLNSRANVVLESPKSRIYFNISGENPAHTPDTPHVQPLSCNFEWTNQKHFYCFLLKPIRDNLAPGFPRALYLSPLHAPKSSGWRLSCTEKNIAHDVQCWKINLTPLYVGEKISNSREVWEKNLLQYKLNQ